MNYSAPTNLGILACPGGEYFAEEIINHLKRSYKRKFEKKVQAIARNYNMETEDIIRKINFYRDISDPGLRRGPVTQYRNPQFRIKSEFTHFANGEFKTRIGTSVRGKDVYIIQDPANEYPVKFNGSDEEHPLSVNDHIMCLLVTIDAAMRADAHSVTLVLPTYPYSRQHKRKGREGLTASHLGRILDQMGVSRIITLDIHSHEIQHSFHHLYLENLHASYQIIRKLLKIINIKQEDLVVVAPDTGAIDRNKYFASSLHKPLAMIYKERDYSRSSKSAQNTNITRMRLLGDVKGKTVFMSDDMLGTGGTLLTAIKHLKEEGAEKIIIAISLPFFNGEAVELFDEAYKQGCFYRIIGTNAVYHNSRLLDKEWYVSANVSELFARVITRLHQQRSVSALLDNTDLIQRLVSYTERQE